MQVIIWSADNFNSLGLLRQLGGRDIDLFFLMMGKPTGCASASRYFTKSFSVNNIKEGYEFLMSHFTSCEQKPLIVTPNDEIIEFIDLHKAEMSPHFLLPGTKESGKVKWTDDKNHMASLATKHGFLVPESKYCAWNSDISDVKFPCIIKPAHTTPEHRNEFKFQICKDEKELQKALKLVRHESEFIIQQYIPKESVALVYGARLSSGKTITAGTLLKDRFASCGDGTHGLVTASYPAGVNTEHIAAFFEDINYCGLFSVEYGIYEGKAYFFEVNLRNDGTSHFFYQAGANIPLAWVYDMFGKDNKDICTTVQQDAWYIDEIFDIANVWNHSISRRKWKEERKQATVFKYYDSDDTAPYFSMKKHRLKKIVMDAVVKKYRPYIVYLMDKFKK